MREHLARYCRAWCGTYSLKLGELETSLVERSYLLKIGGVDAPVGHTRSHSEHDG